MHISVVRVLGASCVLYCLISLSGISVSRAEDIPGKKFTADFTSSSVCDRRNPIAIVKQNVAQMLYWRASDAGLMAHFDNITDPRKFFANSSQAVRSQCLATQASCDNDLVQIRIAFQTYMRELQANGVSKDKKIVGHPTTNSLQEYMADESSSGLSCAPEHPALPGADNATQLSTTKATQPTLPQAIVAGLKRLRLRGTADQMSANHEEATSSTPGADPTHSSQPYYANQGAKLSLSNDGTQHSQTDKIIGAIGLPVDLGWHEGANTETEGGPLTGLWWTPYVGFDREATFKQSSKPSTSSPFSANFVDFGSVFEKYFGAIESIVMVRPDYLSNSLDHSRLFTTNLRLVPLTEIPLFRSKLLVYLPINHYFYIGEDRWLGYMMRVDARAVVGHFVDVGQPTDPRLNKDYLRIGGSIGPAFEFHVIPDYPIEVSAVYTDFTGVRGFHKDLGNFQSSISIDIGPSKIAAITASYINGRREDTTARINMTTIGLTLQY